MKKIISCGMLLSFINVGFAQNGINNKAKELVGKMTTEEKVCLLVGRGMKFPGVTQTNIGTGVGQTMEKVDRKSVV